MNRCPTRLRGILEKERPCRNDEEFYIAIIQQIQETIEGRSFVITPNAFSIVRSWGRCTFRLSRGLHEWIRDQSAGYITDDSSLSKDTMGLGFFEEKANFAILAFTLVGLINAEGIAVEQHRAPKFINKKREAKGKLPPFEYHLLKINPALKMPGHVTAGARMCHRACTGGADIFAACHRERTRRFVLAWSATKAWGRSKRTI